MMVGGFSDSSIDSLDDMQQSALDFIDRNVPEMNDWKLIKLSQQVVAGMNYCFTFENRDVDSNG